MFAAAAVAAAAALTAISTTSTNPTNYSNTSGSNINTERSHSLSQKTYISWAQYAHDRRNSLQRRKIEISKRLENASKANKTNEIRKHINIEQFQSKDLLDKNKLAVAGGSSLSTVSATNHSDQDHSHPKNILKLLHLLESKEAYEMDEKDVLRDLSASVCNQFMELHQFHQENVDEATASHPSYKNFQLLSTLKDMNPEEYKNCDMNQIRAALMQYVQVNSPQMDGTDTSQLLSVTNSMILGAGATSQPSTTNANSSISQLKRQNMLMQQSNRKKEERLNYLFTHRWDPDWLRKARNTLSIPVTILTFACLIFAIVNANWVRLEDTNQRAGLWILCNKTVIANLPADIYPDNLTTILTTNPPPTAPHNEYIDTSHANNINNNNSQKTSYQSRLANTRRFLQERFGENCFSSFFLKEDTQLIVLVLQLVCFFFHTMGLVLLFIGFFASTTSKTLYYYHSAGECLLTSAILNSLVLVAFISLVHFQYQLPHKLGYSIFISVAVSFVTLFISFIIGLDDAVNDWRIAKVKNEKVKYQQI